MAANNRPAFFDPGKLPLYLAAAFGFARLVVLISMSLEGLRGYGDFIHYFEISRLPGLPFLDYWVEYPPVFPFLAKALQWVAGGREHVFYYLLAFLLSLADAGSLYLFARLAGRWFSPEEAIARGGAYLLVLVCLPYGWWYMEPLVVFCTLLGLKLLFDQRWWKAGLVVGIGAATKFFPLLVVLAAWRRVSWKKAALLAVLGLAPLALLYGLLWSGSPAFTAASLRSQASKGSWETVWALLDGNGNTGLFGPFEERLDPRAAAARRGNPPLVSPWITLLLFGGAGLAFLLCAQPQDERQAAGLVGFAWNLLLLWSPGWSPQWVLCLLPLILLILPGRRAWLFGAVLVLVSLLEWPVLLSRGLFDLLWAPVVLRTLLLAALAAAFAGSVSVKWSGIMLYRNR
jgi:hypothetical protein